MKNPLEGLFSNPKKKAKDAAIAAAFTASVLNASAAEKPATTTQNPEVAKTEMGARVETSKDTASTVSMEAEQVRLEQIKKLEERIERLNVKIHELKDTLHSVQSDFQSNYQRAVEYKYDEGKDRTKAVMQLSGFDGKLADLAMKMGREKVAKFDITNEQAVNGLLGILLSAGENGPLKKESLYLTMFMQGQLGPATSTSGLTMARGYQSPDMQIHQHLGQDPRRIVETSLKIVKEEHKLEQAKEELKALMAIPGPESMAAN